MKHRKSDGLQLQQKKRQTSPSPYFTTERRQHQTEQDALDKETNYDGAADSERNEMRTDMDKEDFGDDKVLLESKPLEILGLETPGRF